MLIITNLYDGLFAGGALIMASELSAEIGYPVSESLSVGFVNAAQYFLRFCIEMPVDLLVFKETDPDKRERPDVPTWIYYVLMAIFFVLTILAYVLIIKSPFVLNRSLTDACIKVPESDSNSSAHKEQENLSERLIENMTEGRE